MEILRPFSLHFIETWGHVPPVPPETTALPKRLLHFSFVSKQYMLRHTILSAVAFYLNNTQVL